MTERLTDSQELWDGHARRDPLWAILPSRRRRAAAGDTERFFQTGVAEISHILYHLRLREHQRRPAPGARLRLRRRPAVTGARAAFRARGRRRRVSRDGRTRAVVNRHGERVAYHANDRPDLVDFPRRHVRPRRLEHRAPAHRAGRRDAVPARVVPRCSLRAERSCSSCRHVSASPTIRRCPTSRIAEFRTCLKKRTGHHSRWLAHRRPRCCRTRRLRSRSTSPTPARFEWSRAAFGIIRVGNHWFDDTGYTMLVGDDGRTSIPEPLFPGDRCHVQLTATAPHEPGDYWCEIDLAHEGVVWFRERGSRIGAIPRACQHRSPRTPQRSPPPADRVRTRQTRPRSPQPPRDEALVLESSRRRRSEGIPDVRNPARSTSSPCSPTPRWKSSPSTTTAAAERTGSVTDTSRASRSVAEVPCALRQCQVPGYGCPKLLRYGLLIDDLRHPKHVVDP